MADDAPSPWWEPVPLTWLMWAEAAWCAVVGWIGLQQVVTGSDPAGNGIGTGYIQGLAALGLICTGGLVLACLVLRWRPVRYGIVALLGLLWNALLPLTR